MVLPRLTVPTQLAHLPHVAGMALRASNCKFEIMKSEEGVQAQAE